MSISERFLKPNTEGVYWAQPSQSFLGLWTPYGVVSPMMVGIWPDGSMTITYLMIKGAKFTKSQRKKIDYVKKRGVEVDIQFREEAS